MTAADSTATTARTVDWWRHLATLLTGGALVSFAGSALTFIYFWKIGGVPIGQAAGTGSMAKVVLSSTFMLGGLLLMGWLSPTILFQLSSDDGPFAQRVRQIFSDSDSEKDAKVNFKNIAYFAASTVGIGCFSITLIAFGVGVDENHKWTWISYTVCLVIPIFLIGYFLSWKWLSFNHSSDRDYKGEPYPDSSNKFFHLAGWLFIGYGSAAMSLFPLLTLLLIFLKTEFLLEQDSYAALGAGALVISLGIFIAYTFSLAILVRRSKNFSTQWAIVLAVNAFILFGVVMAFGMASKILDVVMEMSSVRIERAIMMLEPEGCELLKLMQATGVKYTEGASKSCLLYDVTIQSTLEPAMQVACWRGSIVPREEKKVDPVKSDAASVLEISGKPGAFTIPTKFVRSVWKTGGVKSENKIDVCPKKMSFIID